MSSKWGIGLKLIGIITVYENGVQNLSYFSKRESKRESLAFFSCDFLALLWFLWLYTGQKKAKRENTDGLALLFIPSILLVFL